MAATEPRSSFGAVFADPYDGSATHRTGRPADTTGPAGEWDLSDVDPNVLWTRMPPNGQGHRPPLASEGSRLSNSSRSEDSSEPLDAVIEAENVHKTYLLGIEGVPALRGVNLRIMRGEFVILYGTSGGGKTSLLNVIGTIDKPTKGNITVCGTTITSRTTDRELAYIRLRRLGFVFQTFNLLPTMSAIENVELPMVLAGILSPAQRRARAKQLLQRVGLGDRLTHTPSQLSGGEQQRVTICRAIANKPDVLLLDEPTGDLDTKNTQIVMRLLHQLNEEDNITMVMVTHDVNLKDHANRIVQLRDGKILRIDSVSREKQLIAMNEVKSVSYHEEFRAKEDEAGGAGSAGDEAEKPAEPQEKAESESLHFTQIRHPHEYALAGCLEELTLNKVRELAGKKPLETGGQSAWLDAAQHAGENSETSDPDNVAHGEKDVNDPREKL